MQNLEDKKKVLTETNNGLSPDLLTTQIIKLINTVSYLFRLHKLQSPVATILY